MRLQNISTGKYINHLVQTTVFGLNNIFSVSVLIPNGYQLGDNSACIGISYDDTEQAQGVIYIPPTSLANLREQVQLTLVSATVTWDTVQNVYTGTITTSPALDADAKPSFLASLSGILQGVSTSKSAIIYTVTQNGELSFTFVPPKDSLGQRVLFPAGSTISVDAATFNSPLKKYILEE